MRFSSNDSVCICSGGKWTRVITFTVRRSGWLDRVLLHKHPKHQGATMQPGPIGTPGLTVTVAVGPPADV
jgi:hypothetical protein